MPFLGNFIINISKKTGISEFVIGTFIVGFGTSLPELFVSCLASWNGLTGMALGNAYGSNIFNIAFILGVSCMICPLVISRKTLLKSIGALIVISGLSFLCCYDQSFSRIECFWILGCFGLGLTQFIDHKNQKKDIQNEKQDTQNSPRIIPSFIKCFIWLFALVASSRFLVYSGTEIAKLLGVSDLVIGLTIVAAGTSLPELASSISAAKRKKTDLILGNILGSNFFNTGVVVGISGLVSPYSGICQEIIFRDIVVMGIMALSIWFLSYKKKESYIMDWKTGMIWILSFGMYLQSTI